MSLKKCLTFCVLFIPLATNSIKAEEIRDYNLTTFVRLIEGMLDFQQKNVTENDVSFFLFTRSESHVRISENDGKLDVGKNTKFIIHGYIDNHNRSWYKNMTVELLKKGDYNIIQVDWWRIALSFYLQSAQNTKLVGEYISKFILSHQIPVKNVHLIGHSLGAHAAGFAAKAIKERTGEKIARISALDPAGPAFQFFVSDEERLQQEDAEIVDVYHTDGGMFGLLSPVGTLDIYFNSGIREQPECRKKGWDISSLSGLFQDSYCSHVVSYLNFIEAINNIKFKCKKCDNWFRNLIGYCSSTDYYIFGVEDVDGAMTGTCYVNTSEIIKNQ